MLDLFRPRNIIKCTCGQVPLTEEQLTNIFKAYDSNRDGYLSTEELRAAFRELGSIFPGYRAVRALHRVDRNGDGLIDKKELEQLVQYASKRGYSLRNACSASK
ncbi:hypothetical protein A4A49_00311 [Nicotiana attenuata]|uniref:EF-hand domain-containing protein n=1 Tax=Nicotiana attenuata TaxID=49451 RepID=A0A1J6IU85_NICAT|nr:hypothetical protein A4A49_00311 [Nicotiana attenuata]